MVSNILTPFCAVLYCNFSFEKCYDLRTARNTQIRTFYTIKSYHDNFISFNPDDRNFEGSSVSFKTKGIENLYENIFSVDGAEFITQLTLYANNIRNIDDGAFDVLKCLHDLELQNNGISHITNRTFSNLPYLVQLDLSENYLRKIPENSFTFNVHLKNLNFSNNKITALNPYSFYNLTSLEILDLSHNRLRQIDPETFRFSQKLLSLNLAFNFFIDFHIQMFNLTKLKRFNLAGNNLQKFYCDHWWPNATALVNLNLEDNNLTILNAYKLAQAFPRLISVRLDGNPWHCQELLHTITILKKSKIDIITTVKGTNCSQKYRTDYRHDMASTKTMPLKPMLLYIVCIALSISFSVAGYAAYSYVVSKYPELVNCRRNQSNLLIENVDEEVREDNFENRHGNLQFM